MSRYEQTSAQVKSFENQAKRLSSDAIEESKMADGMLKDIANMEQNLPPSLQVMAGEDRFFFLLSSTCSVSLTSFVLP